jgi:hypothetical protein
MEVIFASETSVAFQTGWYRRCENSKPCIGYIISQKFGIFVYVHVLRPKLIAYTPYHY